MMVAIPELDGATAPMVFGGRSVIGEPMTKRSPRYATRATSSKIASKAWKRRLRHEHSYQKQPSRWIDAGRT